MEDRIGEEFLLLKEIYPGGIWQDRWIWLPAYQLPSGWNMPSTPIAFHVREGYPGVSPYGIHVASGLRFNGAMPKDFTDPSTGPPFDGKWAMFSWEAKEWRPASNPRAGHNLLTWVNGFATRFSEGV